MTGQAARRVSKDLRLSGLHNQITMTVDLHARLIHPPNSPWATSISPEENLADEMLRGRKLTVKGLVTGPYVSRKRSLQVPEYQACLSPVLEILPRLFLLSLSGEISKKKKVSKTLSSNARRTSTPPQHLSFASHPHRGSTIIHTHSKCRPHQSRHQRKLPPTARPPARPLPRPAA